MQLTANCDAEGSVGLAKKHTVIMKMDLQATDVCASEERGTEFYLRERSIRKQVFERMCDTLGSAAVEMCIEHEQMQNHVSWSDDDGSETDEDIVDLTTDEQQPNEEHITIRVRIGLESEEPTPAYDLLYDVRDKIAENFTDYVIARMKWKFLRYKDESVATTEQDIAAIQAANRSILFVSLPMN